MFSEIDVLLGRYDSGQLSRRELLGALATLCLPFPVTSQAAPAIGPAKTLNHVTCYVADVERSRKFYHDLFGLPVLTPQPSGLNLRVGSSFLGLYPADEGGRKGIDHFCLGLETFDPERIRKRLAARGIEASIRERGETKELYFTDPDGIRIQLQDLRYRGGVGPLGDQDPK